jgi:hypothetical protein
MRWPTVFAVLALAGEGDASGPFDGLPLDGNFRVAVDAPVHVARDRYGSRCAPPLAASAISTSAAIERRILHLEQERGRRPSPRGPQLPPRFRTEA